MKAYTFATTAYITIEADTEEGAVAKYNAAKIYDDIMVGEDVRITITEVGNVVEIADLE